MKIKKSLENLFSIPYKIGGLKNINFSNPLIRSEYFEESNTHKKKNYNESDLFPFLVLPGKLSNKTYNQVDKLYSIYINDLLCPDSINSLSENLNNKNKEANSDKSDYYSKSFLKHFYSLFNNENQISFEDWRSSIHEKYEIFNFSKGRKVKNKIIFDKIFVHLNYSENAFDVESQKIKHTEHCPSKKFYVFNYKPKIAPVAKKFKVRLSFWIRASNPLIIDKTNDYNNKIHKDEMHHMLLELEDDIEELNYLRLFSRFSFVNLFRNMIDSKKQEGRINAEKTLANLKICDFDFFVGENDNLNKSSDKDGFNEYFYIKFL